MSRSVNGARFMVVDARASRREPPSTRVARARKIVLRARPGGSALDVDGLLAPLALGFLLGLRHATDADHVVAVSAIVARERSLRAASLIGAMWGLGHTATLFVVGGAIVLFGVVIPPHVGLGIDFAFALMLIALGALNLLLRAPPHRARARAHARRAGRALRDPAAHEIERSCTASPGRRPSRCVVLAAMRDARAALAYLALFGVGTVAGMVLLTTMMAAPLNLAARSRASTRTSRAPPARSSSALDCSSRWRDRSHRRPLLLRAALDAAIASCIVCGVTLARATSLLLAVLASSTLTSLAHGCSSSNGGGPETPTPEAVRSDAAPDAAHRRGAERRRRRVRARHSDDVPEPRADVDERRGADPARRTAGRATPTAASSRPIGPLGSYADVFAARNTILGQLHFCDMPPADAPLAMPDAPRDTFLAWIKCGALDESDSRRAARAGAPAHASSRGRDQRGTTRSGGR